MFADDNNKPATKDGSRPMSDMTQEFDRADRWRAFAIHLLTASGAFMAFLSLIAAAEQRWVAMFGWLGLALFIDGIDGPMARKVNVKGVLPNWSGDLLDSIIDYATYSLIPAVALYLSGMIGRPYSFVAAALIVISSAIYYADTRMKTTDNFFRGFPVAWNFLVFTLFAVQPPEWAAFGLVVICAVGTFLPVKFVHPVRVRVLRPLTLAIVAIWSVFGVLVLFQNFEPTPIVRWGLVASGLYLLFIGAVLQFIDWLRGTRHT